METKQSVRTALLWITPITKKPTYWKQTFKSRGLALVAASWSRWARCMRSTMCQPAWSCSWLSSSPPPSSSSSQTRGPSLGPSSHSLSFLLATSNRCVSHQNSFEELVKNFWTQVYDGIWGYNGLLSMAAVSCVFFPFSPTSLLAGALNAVATVGVQAALRRNMDTVWAFSCKNFVTNVTFLRTTCQCSLCP